MKKQNQNEKEFNMEKFMDDVLHGIQQHPDLSLSPYEFRRIWQVVRQTLIAHEVWKEEEEKDPKT